MMHAHAVPKFGHCLPGASVRVEIRPITGIEPNSYRGFTGRQVGKRFRREVQLMLMMLACLCGRYIQPITCD